MSTNNGCVCLNFKKKKDFVSKESRDFFLEILKKKKSEVICVCRLSIKIYFLKKNEF